MEPEKKRSAGWIIGFVAIALLLLLALPVLARDRPAPITAPNAQETCRTFESRDVIKQVAEGALVTSKLPVAMSGYISSIQLNLSATHPDWYDFYGWLCYPGMASCPTVPPVLEGVGEYDVSYSDMGTVEGMIFNLPTSGTVYTESFKYLIGKRAATNWTLNMYSVEDTGWLLDWSLDICTTTTAQTATVRPTSTPTLTPTGTPPATATPHLSCYNLDVDEQCWSASGGFYAGKSCTTYIYGRLSKQGSPCGNYETSAESFYRFDVSAVPTDTFSVYLLLYPRSALPRATSCPAAPIEARAVEDDTWTAGVMSWGGRPAMSDFLDSITDDEYRSPSDAPWWTSWWNVTSWVLSEASGDGLASIGIRYADGSPIGDTDFTMFNNPTLYICDDIPPVASPTPPPCPTMTPRAGWGWWMW